MNIYVLGFLWVVAAAAGAGGIAYLVRRLGMEHGRPDNNDAAGQIFTIVAGLHAVLIAFILISLFDTSSAVHDGAQQEANSLVATVSAADALPEPTRTQVRELGRSYANTVLAQEWPQMSTGHEVSGPGWAQLDQIRAAITMATTNGDWQSDRQTEAANQLQQVYQARQARLSAASDAGVTPVVWFVLVAGSVMTLVLANFFGGTTLWTHIVVTTTLAGMIGLLLFAIYELQDPFSGGAKIGPDAFRWAVDRVS